MARAAFRATSTPPPPPSTPPEKAQKPPGNKRSFGNKLLYSTALCAFIGAAAVLGQANKEFHELHGGRYMTGEEVSDTTLIAAGNVASSLYNGAIGTVRTAGDGVSYLEDGRPVHLSSKFYLLCMPTEMTRQLALAEEKRTQDFRSTYDRLMVISRNNFKDSRGGKITVLPNESKDGTYIQYTSPNSAGTHQQCKSAETVQSGHRYNALALEKSLTPKLTLGNILN